MTVLNILVGVKRRSCFTLAKRTVCQIAYLFEKRYKGLRTNVTTSFTKIFTSGNMEGAATFEILDDAEDLLKDTKKYFEVRNTEKRLKYSKKAINEYVMLNECFFRSLVRKEYRYGLLFKMDVRVREKRHNNYVRVKSYFVNYNRDGFPL